MRRSIDAADVTAADLRRPAKRCARRWIQSRWNRYACSPKLCNIATGRRRDVGLHPIGYRIVVGVAAHDRVGKVGHGPVDRVDRARIAAAVEVFGQFAHPLDQRCVHGGQGLPKSGVGPAVAQVVGSGRQQQSRVVGQLTCEADRRHRHCGRGV